MLTHAHSGLLTESSTPLRIWTGGNSEPKYHLPRSLLERVSPKLTTTCSQGQQLVNLSHEVLCHFAAWLLYRKLDLTDSDSDSDETPQTQLAQAWNFGAEYDITAFQNKVMQELLMLLGLKPISKKATIEAYRPKERGTLLQKAFVLYLPSDMKEDLGWGKEGFTSCILGEDPTFLLDLTLALSESEDAGLVDRDCFMLDTDDDED